MPIDMNFVCIISAEGCDSVTTVDYGSVSPVKSFYPVKEVVTYTCNHGYNLTGNSVLKCTTDDIWNGTAPYCSGTRTGLQCKRLSF